MVTKWYIEFLPERTIPLEREPCCSTIQIIKAQFSLELAICKAQCSHLCCTCLLQVIAVSVSNIRKTIAINASYWRHSAGRIAWPKSIPVAKFVHVYKGIPKKLFLFFWTIVFNCHVEPPQKPIFLTINKNLPTIFSFSWHHYTPGSHQ